MGNKNIDRVIVLKLYGKDLLSFSSSCRYLNNLCNEELFRNRIRNTSLWNLKSEYPKLNYREFYALMMYYISLLKERYNFNYDLSPDSFGATPTGDPKVQYRLLKNNKGNELLTQASASGELQLVKWLLQNGLDIHARHEQSLSLAALNGRLEVVKYLVEQGADIHALDDHALRNAARYGYLKVVKYLVEHGANIHAVNLDNNKHLEVVKYLETLM